MRALVLAICTLHLGCGSAGTRPSGANLACRTKLADLGPRFRPAAQVIPRDLYGKKIAGVTLFGHRAVSEEFLQQVIQSRAGQPLTRVGIQDDIRRLWALEVFSDIHASVAMEKGAPHLSFTVVERAIVGAVRLAGVPDTGDAWERHRLLSGELFVPSRVRRLEHDLVTHYIRKGHLSAEVEVFGKRAGTAKIDLCFTAKLGPRYAIGNVAIDGNRLLSESFLRKNIATKDGRFNSKDGVYLAQQLTKSLRGITDLYYDRGAINVRIGQPRVQIDHQATTVQIVIPIDEGPVFRLGTIEFTGDLGLPMSAYRQTLRIHTGDVFNRSSISESMVRIRELEGQRNQRLVDVTPTSDIDNKHHRINLKIELSDLEPTK